MAGSKKGEHRGNARRKPATIPIPDSVNGIMRQALRGEAPARHTNRGGRRGANASTTDERIEIHRVIHGVYGDVTELTPKEVMLYAMHSSMAGVMDWQTMLEQYAAIQPPTEASTRLVQHAEAEIERMTDRAREAARDCAPYIHPKLSAVQVSAGAGANPMSIIQDMLDELDARQRAEPLLLEHMPTKKTA
jgi:hypothetical protein